jgi:hypothetical protein
VCVCQTSKWKAHPSILMHRFLFLKLCSSIPFSSPFVTKSNGWLDLNSKNCSCTSETNFKQLTMHQKSNTSLVEVRAWNWSFQINKRMWNSTRTQPFRGEHSNSFLFTRSCGVLNHCCFYVVLFHSTLMYVGRC